MSESRRSRSSLSGVVVTNEAAGHSEERDTLRDGSAVTPTLSPKSGARTWDTIDVNEIVNMGHQPPSVVNVSVRPGHSSVLPIRVCPVERSSSPYQSGTINHPPIHHSRSVGKWSRVEFAFHCVASIQATQL